MVVATLLLVSLGAGPVHAVEPHGPAPGSHDQAVIDGRAGTNGHGRLAVNMAAGAGNAQANLAAMAGIGDGPGFASIEYLQRPGATDRQAHATARIEDGAFGGGRGLVGVNQVAGSGNAQANVFLAGQGVALHGDGPGFAGDDVLAATAGDPTPIDPHHAPAWRREAVIADDAFRGSQGVVQVNQTAGVGNNSANAIVIQLPGGSP
jgi:hypothetical protein